MRLSELGHYVFCRRTLLGLNSLEKYPSLRRVREIRRRILKQCPETGGCFEESLRGGREIVSSAHIHPVIRNLSVENCTQISRLTAD